MTRSPFTKILLSKLENVGQGDKVTIYKNGLLSKLENVGQDEKVTIYKNPCISVIIPPIVTKLS